MKWSTIILLIGVFLIIETIGRIINSPRKTPCIYVIQYPKNTGVQPYTYIWTNHIIHFTGTTKIKIIDK